MEIQVHLLLACFLCGVAANSGNLQTQLKTRRLLSVGGGLWLKIVPQSPLDELVDGFSPVNLLQHFWDLTKSFGRFKTNHGGFVG